MKITNQQTTEKYKAEITRLRERDIKQRSTIRSLTANRDNLKAKHESKLVSILKLKIDGHLELTNKEIAERYFASYSHVHNLSTLIHKGIK